MIVISLLKVYHSSLLCLGRCGLDCRQLGSALLHVGFPHRLELRQHLQVSLPIFVEVLLDNQGPFVEASGLQVENVVTGLEVLDGLLISIEHHQATTNVILKNRVLYGLNTQTESVHALCLLEASQSVFVFLHVVQCSAHANVGMRADFSFNRGQHSKQF